MLRKYIQYAREKVRPKLHHLDEDKLSRLFADLRRESLSTGSYPITIRHLESMIRMAEASAKMHLREYVRADDIDLAIQCAVGSFVSAQKLSIKKQLERGFRKYLRVAQDNDELLGFLLGQLIKDKVRYLTHKRNGEPPEQVVVKVSELDERVRILPDGIALGLTLRTGKGRRDLRHHAVPQVGPVQDQRLLVQTAGQRAGHRQELQSPVEGPCIASRTRVSRRTGMGEAPLVAPLLGQAQLHRQVEVALEALVV